MISILGVPQDLSDDEFKILFRKYKSGDIESKNKIIEKHLYVVNKVTNIFSTPYDKDDLLQEGYFGLEHALKKYKPEKNIKFNTYAFKWVYLYVRHALIKLRHSIRLPIYLYNLQIKLKKVIPDFERENG